MSSLVGTRALARLALRRDRIVLSAFIAVVTLVCLATASAFAKLYPTAASRVPIALSIGNNPTLRALIGPPFDLGSIGGLTAWRVGGIGAVLAALMSLFTVVRHTRAEEEAGRMELLGAGVVGRHAALFAALLVAFGANLVLALVVAAGLIALGLPAAGALALGLALACAGWLFAAIAAVAAQATERARAANSIAAGLVGLSFLVRAAGDAAGGDGQAWLSWLSPIGWTQQVRPFAGERWWLLALAGGVALCLAGTAHALVARRDVGAGLLPPRLGAAEASPRLGSALALAWRLHRGAMLGWGVGFAVAGTTFGSVAEGVADLVHGNPQLEMMLTTIGGAQRIVDAFFAATMSIGGMVAAAYAVQAVLRLRVEETGLRAEPILATSVGRTRWALGHLGLAAIGPAILLCVLGLAAAIAHGLRAGDVAGEIPRLVGAALVQLPASWVVGAISAELFGFAPRQANASWAALAIFFLIEQLGPLLQLPAWAMDVSPFAHVPKLPGAALAIAPIVGLCGVAATLTGVGLVGFRRRDVG